MTIHRRAAILRGEIDLATWPGGNSALLRDFCARRRYRYERQVPSIRYWYALVPVGDNGGTR